ncbi:NPCBM/NEW2 domain-containing protein [Peribacillus sp. NPDC097295]|uniref:NPCBM/NEW2 domain-containing protein n=1 Tax=Peribacillus sp. NPDC097295 TaxID=3364402 RepID=UPI00381AA504
MKKLMGRRRLPKMMAVAVSTTLLVGYSGTANVLAAPTMGSIEVASENNATETKSTSVTTFELFSNRSLLDAYNAMYKMASGNIQSLENNGGSYSTSTLANMLDGNLDTHWETGKPNATSFTNEITFKFDKATKLDRVVYAPRLTGASGKGFAKEFEIYGSTTNDSDDFELVASGEYKGNVRDAIEIQFNPTKFKQLKFVFKKANEQWAAASEFMFYKEDAIAKKMNGLFEDEKLTKVSDAYNTPEKLAALEKEIAAHPFQEDFMERIEDAKNVLAMEEIFPSTTKTKAFKHYGNAAYKEHFMIPLTNLKRITNNGGHYAQSVLKNAVDGNTDTYWETNRANTADFKNTVEVEFKDAVTIDRLVYGARPSDNKGFITGFDVYISPTSAGETYQLVSSGSHSKVSGLIEAKFNPAKAKRVKLVVTDSDQAWATLSELAFFTKDEIADQVEDLFTDGTQSAIKEAYNSLTKINELETKAKNHLLYNDLLPDLELAKKIVQGQVKIEGTIIQAEQVGNRRGYASSRLKSNVGSNLQSTGLAAKAGAKITVYVEANGATKLPAMVFSQTQGSWSSWNRSVQLTKGKNVITVPKVSQDGYGYAVTSGGAIYITNPYTKSEQGGTPVIRIEGAQDFPVMTKDTNPDAFKAELANHKAKVDADKAKHANLADREMLDVVELVSDHIIYSGTTSAAYKAYITEGKDPKATVDGYDKWMHRIFSFHGIDGTNQNRKSTSIRENIRLMQPYGFMYAAGDHTGIQLNEEGLLFNDLSKVYPGWGLNHEIGHRIDNGARLWGEVTNNMTSMGMSVKYKSIDNRIPYNDIYQYVIGENKVDFDSLGLAEKLGAFWQLEMAHPGYWAELENLYRERNIQSASEAQKQQNMVKISSDVLKKDLSTHFARHGFNITEATKAYTGKYEKPDKYWYLNNSVINYKGNGFTEDASVDVNIATNESKKTNMLTFAMDNANKSHALGYEILRDGELIGFTSSGSFTDKNVDAKQNYDYQVVAYDKKLKTLDPVGVKAFKPTLSVSDQLTLKLNQAFNAPDFVKAYDHNGADITSDVQVQSSNLDITKRGDYQVTFVVTSQGVTETETVDVKVVSDYDYLSDIKTKSYKIDWGGLKLDKAPQGGSIQLLRDGVAATYEKGIGAHANSEIVYDVAGKGYNHFESYIGIDQAMKGQNASATFEVWVDDEKIYTSGVFGSGTEHQFIKVPIKDGTKTVSLVTTDAAENHNTSDHTVWADAKFTKDDSKPVISVKSEATKVGAPIDIEGDYSATDVEDGNLTSKVKITGTDRVDFDNPGKYDITYTVTDSDGNEMTAIRTVSVVDMKDYKYLSSYNWKSESHTYAAPVKNKATSGNALRLTGENGNIISYEKGIGAHSKSTIIYDLTDKDAAYFSSFVGIDRQMYNTVGSVDFQVFVDGVKKFDSGLMTSNMVQKYVEVDVAGAQELKLVVTDGGNGNGSDHATWADAKLHYANVN